MIARLQWIFYLRIKLQRNPLAAEVSLKNAEGGCLVFGASLCLKLNPRGGFVVLISGSFCFFCFMGTASWVHRYSIVCCKNACDSFLSASPPSVWVTTAVGFGVLLSRMSHSLLSCPSVLGRRMIISQLCRVKSCVYKQKHFTDMTPWQTLEALQPLLLPSQLKKKQTLCFVFLLQYIFCQCSTACDFKVQAFLQDCTNKRQLFLWHRDVI